MFVSLRVCLTVRLTASVPQSQNKLLSAAADEHTQQMLRTEARAHSLQQMVGELESQLAAARAAASTAQSPRSPTRSPFRPSAHVDGECLNMLHDEAVLEAVSGGMRERSEELRLMERQLEQLLKTANNEVEAVRKWLLAQLLPDSALHITLSIYWVTVDALGCVYPSCTWLRMTYLRNKSHKHRQHAKHLSRRCLSSAVVSRHAAR